MQEPPKDLKLVKALKAKMSEILEEMSDEEEDAEDKVAGDNDRRKENFENSFKGSTNSINVKKENESTLDHKPHDLFIQLNELHGSGEFQEWRETARWIKYEENVEEGADRWGRPHVSSLSFHSLLNVRRCLETGVVMLDAEEKDLPHIVFRAVETVANVLSFCTNFIMDNFRCSLMALFVLKIVKRFSKQFYCTITMSTIMVSFTLA